MLQAFIFQANLEIYLKDINNVTEGASLAAEHELPAVGV